MPTKVAWLPCVVYLNDLAVSGKPVAFTPPDSEFDTPRIQVENYDYEPVLLPLVAAINVFRIQSDLVCLVWRIACSSCFASGGVNRTVTDNRSAGVNHGRCEKA